MPCWSNEYQDVNAIQADIVRLLCPEAGRLTCVGDDAQASTLSAAPIRSTCTSWPSPFPV